MCEFLKIYLAMIFCALGATTALASGDVGCSPAMKLFHPTFTGCDSLGFLAPANDTRINMVYLMADAHHQKLAVSPPSAPADPSLSGYSPTDWANFSSSLNPAPKPSEGTAGDATGEGSVCVSDLKGREQFLSAVAAAADLSNTEKSTLGDARKALQCGGDAAAQPVPVVQSASAKEFSAYLEAITKFYKSNHTDAAAFTTLATAGQPWVKEAASYMQARVLLLATQADAFDEYGTMQKDKINPAAVARALDALNAYLKAYPTGAYAASATGLLRRAYWLGGDKTNQAETYAALLAANQVNEAGLDIVNEMDLKLPNDAYTAGTTSPLLLAVQDLRLMREQLDSSGNPVPGLKTEVLEAQRQHFATVPDLFDYLRAARAWFVDKDAKAVLAILPAKPVPADLTYLEFSRQLLRAAALDKTDDDGARSALVAIFPAAKSAYQRPALELALALHDERHKKVGPDFDAGSLITDPVIRNQLLDYVAGPIILRQQATSTTAPQDERDTALVRLLARDLVQGHFKGFLDDVALLPPKPASTAPDAPADRFAGFRWSGSKGDYPCPGLVDVAKQLNAKPKDVQARLCLGEFFRATSVADATVQDKDSLGGMGTLFSGAPIFRQDIYVDTMKNPAASKADRAYALYRAVRCYEPSHVNECGGKDVPMATRKAWHDELKTAYGDTPWARELKYYW